MSFQPLPLHRFSQVRGTPALSSQADWVGQSNRWRSLCLLSDRDGPPKTDAANADQMQRPHRFQPGVSGNPKGKAPGTGRKTAMAIEALLDGEAEGLTRTASELALTGDGPALRLCIDRIFPIARDRRLSFPMPPLESVADAKAPAAGHWSFKAAASA